MKVKTVIKRLKYIKKNRGNIEVYLIDIDCAKYSIDSITPWVDDNNIVSIDVNIGAPVNEKD